jgi:small subunit ribosomal protein S2
MFYVNNRWLGGTLTNFKNHRSGSTGSTPSTRWKRAASLSAAKKEVIKLNAEREKLEKILGGIRG